MNYAILAEKYKKELLEQVVPFWLEHSQDHQYGGYFTCLLRDGKVFDTDKFIWLQGREVWLFSFLYNKEKIGLKLRTSGGSNQTNPAEIIKRS